MRKIALVTGSTRGIGYGIAKALGKIQLRGVAIPMPHVKQGGKAAFQPARLQCTDERAHLSVGKFHVLDRDFHTPFGGIFRKLGKSRFSDLGEFGAVRAVVVKARGVGGVRRHISDAEAVTAVRHTLQLRNVSVASFPLLPDVADAAEGGVNRLVLHPVLGRKLAKRVRGVVVGIPAAEKAVKAHALEQSHQLCVGQVKALQVLLIEDPAFCRGEPICVPGKAYADDPFVLFYNISSEMKSPFRPLFGIVIPSKNFWAKLYINMS